ncbi:hypothetical protein [Halosimplex sp. TS25]|uniref:hypothetical protein n=1 Tax=Halosimplex rarum TaxID=3396619 RepID=UPI0039E9F93C
MVQLPFDTTERLPKDVTARAAFEKPRLEPTRFDERILARIDVPTVVVHLPHEFLPTTEYGAARLQAIRTIEPDLTVDDIAADLDTATSRLDPSYGPQTFYYSLRKHAVQLSSNTFGRFIDDLYCIDSLVADIEAESPRIGPDPTSDTDSRTINPSDTVTGACVWPTADGLFYCKVRRGDPSDNFSAEYGLLSHGLPLNMTRIQRLFEAVTDDPPARTLPWPLRRLTLQGSTTSVPFLHAVDEAIDTPEADTTPRISHAGQNPVFGIFSENLPIDTSGPERSLYNHLRSVGTLGYTTPSGPQPDAYTLDAIHALDPPTNGVIFVAASLERP